MLHYNIMIMSHKGPCHIAMAIYLLSQCCVVMFILVDQFLITINSPMAMLHFNVHQELCHIVTVIKGYV